MAEVAQIMDGDSPPEVFSPVETGASRCVEGEMDAQELNEAAELLTKQYMKLRLSGSLSRTASGRTTKKKTAKPEPQPMLPPPRQKRYTPGPGAYSPQIDRNAAKCLHSSSFSFGGGNMGQTDRSFIKHYISQQASPGPMYTPNREPTSSLKSIEKVTFKKADMDSRKSYNHGHATNSAFHALVAVTDFGGFSPFHNPGPGSYNSKVDLKGNKVKAGQATASHSFGLSSFFHPEDAFKKTCYITKGHERENAGIHSPGPKYYPSEDSTAKYETIPAYTTAAKGKVIWDEWLDPKNTYQPGPMYNPVQTKQGSKFLETNPKVSFGRETQRPVPSTNLSQTSFITERHAKTINQSVHSPGPKYLPNKPEMYKPTVNFKMSGPRDRFYDPFEPHRLE